MTNAVLDNAALDTDQPSALQKLQRLYLAYCTISYTLVVTTGESNEGIQCPSPYIHNIDEAIRGMLSLRITICRTGCLELHADGHAQHLTTS